MSNKVVIFVLPCLGHGGVERMTLNLCEKLLNDGFDCTIALRKYEGNLLLDINPKISVYELAPKNITQFIPSLSKIIRNLKPIAVISAFPDVAILTWLSIKLSGVEARLIHGVHDTHGPESRAPGIIGWMRKKIFIALAKFSYRCADYLVAVSNGISVELESLFNIAPQKIHKIYNPIIPDDFFSRFQREKLLSDEFNHCHIIALGRLVHQKGFDILIEAMAKITSLKKWRLDIYGNGPAYKSLELLIIEKGLNEKIFLHGFTEHPFEQLASADLFVMPSRHEGFGNVLVEAMACGTPVIAADCNHGPREILCDGEYGVLVAPNCSVTLSEAISNFLEHGTNALPSLVVERARQFTYAASYSKWKEIICAK